MIGLFFLFFLEGVVCSATGINHSSMNTLEVVSLVLLFINTAAIFFYISRRFSEYDGVVMFAIIGSLLLKVALLLWDYYATDIFVLPNSHLDSEGFHNGAVLFANNTSVSVQNYSYLVGYIYRYFGVQRITAQFFNVLLSFAGISLFERTLNILDVGKTSRSRALIFAGLLPNYAIISAILIRECLISFIISIAMYLFARWWKGRGLVYFILAEMVSMLACYYHAGSIAVTIGIAISLVISRNGRENGIRHLNISLKSLIMAIVLFGVFMYMFDALSDTILWRFHGLEMNVIDDYIADHNIYEAAETSSSTYTAGITKQTGLAGIIINSPIRIVYFLWVPMPWDFRGLSDIIAFLGSSLFYGGVVFRSIYRFFRRRVAEDNKTLMLALLLIALSGAMVFAWGVDSAGSALRHREKFFFVYLLLYAVFQQDKDCEMDLEYREYERIGEY